LRTYTLLVVVVLEELSVMMEYTVSKIKIGSRAKFRLLCRSLKTEKYWVLGIVLTANSEHLDRDEAKPPNLNHVQALASPTFERIICEQ